ncbi:CARDB domain-containing protein, partial [Archangium sp.]|uniref:CARDB domain-containing protein n=1 Tax=Archangium sp. TaxID=1872627 RepID=UPI002EDAB5DD
MIATSPAALNTLPDLIVTAVNGPAVARPSGTSPLVLVTVCNQGTMSSSTMAEIYFSSDSTITSSDFRSISLSIPSLNTSQCHTASASAWTPGEGTWYLGAIVDPQNSSAEQREDNNVLVGNVMVTRELPNLTVASVKAAESAVPYGAFTTEVSVCNRGFMDSPQTNLEVRVST